MSAAATVSVSQCSEGHDMVAHPSRLIIVDPEGSAEIHDETYFECEECIEVLVSPPWCGCGECWLTQEEIDEFLRMSAADELEDFLNAR